MPRGYLGSESLLPSAQDITDCVDERFLLRFHDILPCIISVVIHRCAQDHADIVIIVMMRVRLMTKIG